MKTIQEGLNKTSNAFQEFVVSSSSLLLAWYPYSRKEKQSWRFSYNNKDSNVSKKQATLPEGRLSTLFPLSEAQEQKLKHRTNSPLHP